MKSFIPLLAVIVSLNAHSKTDENNFSIGASIGQSTIDVESKFAFENPDKSDDEDTAFKLFASYGLNEYINFKVSYFDLGEATDSFEEQQVDGQLFEFSREIKTTGFALSMDARYLFNESFFAFAEVGAFAWENEHEVKVTVLYPRGNQGSSGDTTDDDIDVFYGFGVGYQFRDFNFTIGYEAFDTKAVDIDVTSIGLEYNF